MTSLMGGGPRHAYAATLPPDRFYCRLDELPLHLVPPWPRTVLRAQNAQPLFLNPDCFLAPADQFPEQLSPQKQALATFATAGTIVWVPDSVTGNPMPFWLGPELEECVRSMKLGEPVLSNLRDEMCAALVEARILLPSGEGELRLQEWDQSVHNASALFRVRGYAPISNLLHPFHIAALRRYYRYLIRSGAVRLGDGQSPRRYVLYNEPVAQFFHQNITKKLRSVVGVPIKPSYVYLASYLSGAKLEKHTDREQCEFSVTLCLDFTPEPAFETPWPIELETVSGTVKVYQALGDALAYRGTRVPHSRGILGAGQTSTSIFFHYVSADFTGSLD